jgi:hypothetical protein
MCNDTAQTCGNCKNWKETTTRCPGMGFCGHPDASARLTRALVPVSCYLMPAQQACKMTA